jgi:hypothetical protein
MLTDVDTNVDTARLEARATKTLQARNLGLSRWDWPLEGQA